MIYLRREFSRAYRAAHRAVAAPVVRRLPGGRRFRCPICGYSGRFVGRPGLTGSRASATCPTCRSSERERVHHVLLDRLLADIPRPRAVLEFAPTAHSRARLERAADTYLTCDLYRSDVDVRCDASSLPFPDGVFDLVVISHVLEHVQDDLAAIAELGRVVAPTGLAFVAVPVVGVSTVEYPAPNALEDYHVRAPGADYYDRLLDVFNWTRPLGSDDVDPVFQPYYLEDRTVFPNSVAPHRQPLPGTRHPERAAITGHEGSRLGEAIDE